MHRYISLSSITLKISESCLKSIQTECIEVTRYRVIQGYLPYLTGSSMANTLNKKKSLKMDGDLLAQHFENIFMMYRVCQKHERYQSYYFLDGTPCILFYNRTLRSK